MTQFQVDPKEKDLVKSLRCPKHPKYKALRKPAVNCGACKHLWRIKQGKA